MSSAIEEPVSLYSPPNTIRMKVALYARVSTARRKEKPQDPETQLFRLREYARREDYEVVEEFVDRASGADPSRPALDRMVADARERRFYLILVCKIDRVARSVINLCSLLEELELYGVKVLCVDQPEISTKGPMGRLLLHVLGALAEFERELIRDRTLAGLQRARAEGKVLGRPRKDVASSEVLELLGNGKSYREAAQQLKISVGLAHARSKKESPEVPSEKQLRNGVHKTDDS